MWYYVAVAWLFNVGLVVSLWQMCQSWDVVTWSVGTIEWAVFVEILVILCVLSMLIIGFAILGCPTRFKDAYLQVRKLPIFGSVLQHSVPFLVLCVLLCVLTPIAVDNSVTNSFLESHANDVFRVADTNHDEQLNVAEFQAYSYSLDRYAGRANDSATQIELSNTFDSMDTDNDGLVSQEDLFQSVHGALDDKRSTFITFAVVGMVCVVGLWLLFWMRVRSFRASRFEYMDPRYRRIQAGDEDDGL